TPVLKQMSEEEVEILTSTIAHLENVNAKNVESALQDFQEQTMAGPSLVKGGPDYVRKLLIETYGPETAMRLLDRLTKSIGQRSVSFEDFRKADPQQLAKFIQDEHPQTIALILSHLDSSQAARLVAALPVETRVEVVVRMADLNQISPEVIRNIASVIGNKLRNLGELNREACGGVRAVA